MFLEAIEGVQGRHYPALFDKLQEFLALADVGVVGALDALLVHPQVADIEVAVVAGRATHDDHHAGAVAYLQRGGEGGLAECSITTLGSSFSPAS